MSNFSPTQRRGCSEILESLSFSNLLALKDTIANKLNAWSKEDIITVILNYSQGAEDLLKRKKVLREAILKYLIKHDVTVSASSDKQQLIYSALFYWRKLDMKRKPLIAQTEFPDLGQKQKEELGQKLVKNAECAEIKSLVPIDMKARELEQMRQTEERKRRVEEELARIQKEQLRSQIGNQVLNQAQHPMKMQMNVYVNLTQNQQPPQRAEGGAPESEKMGKEFCQWFFQLLNSQNPSSGEQAGEWGPQHFWEDAVLHFAHCVNELQTEQHLSSANVSQRLLSLVKDEQLLFNPNISQSGMRCATSPHGVVAIAVAGTIHNTWKCLGIFEQIFGLIRTQVCGNNWKIRYMKLQVKAFNDHQVTTPPSVSVQMPALQDHLNELCAHFK